MPGLTLPALDPATVPERRGSGYPEPFRSRMGDRAKRRLGAACGLTGFGVNLVTLAPGGQSALRHWHTLEDEFVYVLAGELVPVSDAGEQVRGAGMCAGYPAGSGDVKTCSTAAQRRRSIPRSAAAASRTGRSIRTTTCSGSIEREDDLIAAHKDARPYPGA
ncbi:MAG: cupin domain-containing protein [Casimicrobiaceae bacterium]